LAVGLARDLDAVLLHQPAELVIAQAQQTSRDGLLVLRSLESLLERLPLELGDRAPEIDRPTRVAVSGRAHAAVAVVRARRALRPRRRGQKVSQRTEWRLERIEDDFLDRLVRPRRAVNTALDGILELAHVAGPVVREQCRGRLRRE